MCKCFLGTFFSTANSKLDATVFAIYAQDRAEKSILIDTSLQPWMCCVCVLFLLPPLLSVSRLQRPNIYRLWGSMLQCQPNFIGIWFTAFSCIHRSHMWQVVNLIKFYWVSHNFFAVMWMLLAAWRLSILVSNWSRNLQDGLVVIGPWDSWFTFVPALKWKPYALIISLLLWQKITKDIWNLKANKRSFYLSIYLSVYMKW